MLDSTFSAISESSLKKGDVLDDLRLDTVIGNAMMGTFYSFCGYFSSYTQESSLSVGIGDSVAFQLDMMTNYELITEQA